jgi:hypothetical protein
VVAIDDAQARAGAQVARTILGCRSPRPKGHPECSLGKRTLPIADRVVAGPKKFDKAEAVAEGIG